MDSFWFSTSECNSESEEMPATELCDFDANQKKQRSTVNAVADSSK